MSSLSEEINHRIHPDVVRVHVENAHEMRPPVATEEALAEHFTCRTFVVPSPQGGVGGGAKNPNVEQILFVDPTRRSASILSIDSPVILVHSYNLAQQVANQVAGTPFPDGALLPAGASASLDGTGPLWIVATVATASRVTVINNHKDR